ncbi:MAG: GntR family transcriptional regulator [Nocardioidaceae bacterium]
MAEGGGVDPLVAADSRSLSDAVYQRLRDDVLLGRLRPNELLVETELAERLEVSRTPIRESLQRLASEGLVTQRRRRWVVYEHSLDEVRNIYEMRAALEGFAARLASRRASDEQLELAAHAADTAVDLNHGNSEMVDRNDRFHRIVVEAAHNPRLAEAIEQNRLYYFNRQVAPLYGSEEITVSQGHHHALVDALRARDAQRAETIVRTHIRHALQVIEQRRFEVTDHEQDTAPW